MRKLNRENCAFPAALVLLILVAQASVARTVPEAIQEYARSYAEIGARTHADDSAEWFSRAGDLQKALFECKQVPGTFDHKITAPTSDSPQARAICDLIPSAQWLQRNPGYQERCDFIKYNPCEFQITKRLEFDTTGRILTNDHWGTNDPLPVMKPLPTKVVAFISVSCRQVAVLGLAPQWTCGGEFDWTWNIGEWSRQASNTPDFEATGLDYDMNFIFNQIYRTSTLFKILTASGLAPAEGD